MTKISCVVADAQKKRSYSLGPIITDISYETTMLNQPGKLTVRVAESRRIDFKEGSVLYLRVGGYKMFRGYVFTIRKAPHSTEIICYDKIRYLGSQDAVVMSSTSVRKVVSYVSSKTGVKISFPTKKTGTRSLGKKVFDGQSHFQMIKWACDEHLKRSKNMLIIRDVWGKVKILDVSKLMHRVVVGDGSLLTDWEYSSSIDEETFTVVKLVRDRQVKEKKSKGSSSKGKKDPKITRSTLVVKEDKDIKRWGVLQYFEKVDDKMKNASMKKMAKRLLSLYSRPTKTLSVSCLGYAPLRAGDGIGLKIRDLDTEGFAKIKMAFCSSVRHDISHGSHTMELEVVVQ